MKGKTKTILTVIIAILVFAIAVVGTVTFLKEWVPITDKFTGILDGLGHKISGIYINKPTESNQGLFGTLKGTVRNLKMTNGYIKGKSNTGAIAGTNEGTIEDCYYEGIIGI